MKTLLSTILIFGLVAHSNAQSIEKFSIDSGGASANSGGLSVMYTIGEANIQELSAGGISVSEGFINANFRVKIDPKVFLQGPILNPDVANQMNDDLRVLNYIPTTSPYADTANCDASVFTVSGSNAIVDWVWVELRAANDNTKLINGRSALLQRDGDIVDVDGASDLVMTASPTNYYIVIKHRNHLGIMSSGTFGLTENTATPVDFKNNGIPTFGANARVELNSGDMALWAGNADGNTYIQYSGGNPDAANILEEALNDPANFLNLSTQVVPGYNVNDINMNGNAQYSGTSPDSPFILQNVLSHPGNFLNLSTHQIIEQLPEN